MFDQTIFRDTEMTEKINASSYTFNIAYLLRDTRQDFHCVFSVGNANAHCSNNLVDWQVSDAKDACIFCRAVVTRLKR